MRGGRGGAGCQDAWGPHHWAWHPPLGGQPRVQVTSDQYLTSCYPHVQHWPVSIVSSTYNIYSILHIYSVIQLGWIQSGVCKLVIFMSFPDVFHFF